MHLLRRNAKLSTKAKHAAIGEASGGVDHDHGRVDALGEFLDGRIILGDDGFGVARGMRVDVVDGRAQIRHHLDAHLEGQIFSVPILLGGAVEVKALDRRAGDDVIRRGVGLQYNVRLGQSGGDLRQEFGGDILMNQ